MLRRNIISIEGYSRQNVCNIIASYDERTVEVIHATARIRCREEYSLEWNDASPLIQAYFLEHALATVVKRYIHRAPSRKS